MMATVVIHNYFLFINQTFFYQQTTNQLNSGAANKQKKYDVHAEIVSNNNTMDRIRSGLYNIPYTEEMIMIGPHYNVAIDT